MRAGFAALSIATLLAVIVAAPASAQGWPDRPLKIMVGYGVGGGTDIITRIVAEPLGEALGQRVVVENKPGAGGTLAGNAVSKGPKDGYTAFMINTGHTVSAVTAKALAYDPIKDFTPVSLIADSAFVLVANKDFPANDVKELIDLSKRGTKLNYATAGAGSTQHLTAELFKQRTGIKAQHIAFLNTGEVITSLLRKDVSYAFEAAHAVRSQIESGALKALAVTTAERWPLLPNIPTMIESGVPDFKVATWYGLVFPVGVPPEAVAKTQKALAQVLSRDSLKAQFSKLGVVPTESTPEEFSKRIESDIARWREMTSKTRLEMN